MKILLLLALLTLSYGDKTPGTLFPDFVVDFLNTFMISHQPVLLLSNEDQINFNLQRVLNPVTLVDTSKVTNFMAYFKQAKQVATCFVTLFLDEKAVLNIFSKFSKSFSLVVIQERPPSLEMYLKLYSIMYIYQVEVDYKINRIAVYDKPILHTDNIGKPVLIWRSNHKYERRNTGRKSLIGKSININVLRDTPFVSAFRKNKKLVRIGGQEALMINAIAKYYHFNCTLRMRKKRRWGTKVNGTWTGLVADAMNFKCHLVMGKISVTLSRTEAVDFCYPFVWDALSFMTAGKIPVMRWNLLVLMFSPEGWLIIICNIVIWSLALGFITNAVTPGERGSKILAVVRHVFESFFLIFSMIICQVPFNIRKRAALMILVGFIWMGCLIISWGYSGVLKAQLTVVGYSEPPDSFPELISKDYTPIRRGIGSHWSKLIRYSETETFQEINKRMEWLKKSVFYKKLDTEVGEYFHSRKVAYIAGKLFVSSFVDLTEENLRTGKDSAFSGPIAWGVPKGSGLQVYLNYGTLLTIESGLTDKWYEDSLNEFRNYLAGKVIKKTTRKVTIAAVVLTLEHVLPGFLALGLGIVLSLVALMGEIWWAKKITRS